MKARTTGTYLLLALAAIGTVVLLAFRGVCSEAVYPVENASLAFRTRVWTRIVGLFRASSAQAENVRLRREVASLALARGDVERLEAENARLRRALGYVERQPGDWVAAAVLSSGGAAAGSPNVIRVGKGALAGVRDGAVVAAAEGLVGAHVRGDSHNRPRREGGLRGRDGGGAQDMRHTFRRRRGSACIEAFDGRGGGPSACTGFDVWPRRGLPPWSGSWHFA